MRHTVRIVFGASTAVLILTAASPIGRQSLVAQTNWREVRQLRMGRFHTRIDVSSSHTLRLYAQLDTSKLMGEQLSADSVKAWQENLFNDLDKPARMNYALGNAILVQPFASDSATVGYLLTVADTNGVSRQVVTDRDGMEAILDILAKGAAAGMTLSGAKRMRAAPLGNKATSLAHY